VGKVWPLYHANQSWQLSDRPQPVEIYGPQKLEDNPLKYLIDAGRIMLYEARLGGREARLVRAHMKNVFEGDVGGMTGLRCLVLIGRDEVVYYDGG